MGMLKPIKVSSFVLPFVIGVFSLYLLGFQLGLGYKMYRGLSPHHSQKPGSQRALYIYPSSPPCSFQPTYSSYPLLHISSPASSFSLHSCTPSTPSFENIFTSLLPLVPPFPLVPFSPYSTSTQSSQIAFSNLKLFSSLRSNASTKRIHSAASR